MTHHNHHHHNHNDHHDRDQRHLAHIGSLAHQLNDALLKAAHEYGLNLYVSTLPSRAEGEYDNCAVTVIRITQTIEVA